MSRKQTYLFIFAMGLIIIFIGRFMYFNNINMVVNSTWTWMQSPYIFVPAAICAFIFMSNKKYWLINTGIALIASLAVQYLILSGGGTLYTILTRAFAYIVIVYLLNLIKIILDK